MDSKTSEIELRLTEAELQNLMAVLDAGVKSLGVQAVLPLAPVLQKISDATEKSD